MRFLLSILLSVFVVNLYGQTESVYEIKRDSLLAIEAPGNLEEYCFEIVRLDSLQYSETKAYSQSLTERLFYLAQKTENESIVAEATYRMACIKDVSNSKLEAVELYQQATEMFERNGNQRRLGHAHLNCGIAYKAIGMPVESKHHYSESIRIMQQTGETNLLVEAINGLGWVYSSLGDKVTAKKYYLEALDVAKESSDSILISIPLYSIAQLEVEQENFLPAIKSLNEGLSVYRRYGHHRGIISTLNLLGVAYTGLGNHDKSKRYYLEVISHSKSIDFQLGVAFGLSNLGMFYAGIDNNDSAIFCFKEAYEINRVHGQYYGAGLSLGNIGTIYLRDFKVDSALNYFRQSVAIKNAIGDRPGLAILMKNIGDVLLIKEEYDSSLAYYLSSLEISRSVRSQLSEIRALRALSSLYHITAKNTEAGDAIDQLMKLRKKDIQINLNLLSEKEKELYFNSMLIDFQREQEAVFEYGRSGEAIISVFNNSLLTKGILLHSSSAVRSIILNSGNQELIKTYNDWIERRRVIAQKFSSGEEIKELEFTADSIESMLAQRSKELHDLQQQQNLTYQNVQEKMNENEVVIEFVRYVKHISHIHDSLNNYKYGALILSKNSKDIKAVPLFEEPELEKILGTFPGNNLSYIEQVYGSKENTKSQLYDLIWKPMEEELKGAKKVYVSPVGLLHKISFAALAKEQDVYLCDVYDIEMKSSIGKIATQNENSFQLSENSTATIFGGIEYTRGKSDHEIWSYLEGSKIETQKIHKIIGDEFDVTSYSSYNATEEAFKESASKSNILHIATHGFFYQDPDLVKEDLVDEVESKEEIVFRGGRTGMGMNTFVKSRNPLMRSGLAFAGANDVWNRTYIDGEDGVLTAAEVATIDMRNTELVVLSACETGLGDIKGSEGVYGLQRSFKMAGVNYIIMSLWQVPDKETAEFMTTFYKHLTKTNDIKESFKLTQQEMRKKYDPYYWGAFVLVE